MKIYVLILFVLQATIVQAQDFQYLPTSTTGQIVTHHYYALSYSEQNEQAEWVAYELTARAAQGRIDQKD
ncbi:MAG TPA: hypothetical protein VE912_03860 [Bacteroidales bacterium]|nr:hypothetical protein [Bacteroidales bacterium]